MLRLFRIQQVKLITTNKLINQLRRSWSLDAMEPYLWSDFHSSHLRSGRNTTVDWPQWVALGARVWRHQRHLLTSGGDQRGYGLGWDSEPIYITTREDRVGKMRGAMSATAVLNQGHEARSETWRDAEGVKDGEESWREWGRDARKGAEVRGGSRANSRLSELGKSSTTDRARRWLNPPEWVQSSSDRSKHRSCCFGATWEARGCNLPDIYKSKKLKAIRLTRLIHESSGEFIKLTRSRVKNSILEDVSLAYLFGRLCDFGMFSEHVNWNLEICKEVDKASLSLWVELLEAPLCYLSCKFLSIRQWAGQLGPLQMCY